jgi:hypothetical protein
MGVGLAYERVLDTVGVVGPRGVLATSYGFYVTGSNVYWSSILAMLVVTP